MDFNFPITTTQLAEVDVDDDWDTDLDTDTDTPAPAQEGTQPSGLPDAVATVRAWGPNSASTEATLSLRCSPSCIAGESTRKFW